jgi:hypothetical protein
VCRYLVHGVWQIDNELGVKKGLGIAHSSTHHLLAKVKMYIYLKIWKYNKTPDLGKLMKNVYFLQCRLEDKDHKVSGQN